MPRPPFIFSRETERAAVDRVIHNPLKRQMLYDMIDAVLRVRETGAVSPADLAPILAGFGASDEAVWSRAAGWLGKLHSFEPQLSASLEELSGHRSAAVRFHLCASMDEFPREIAVTYLRRFLRDKSSRVRGTVLNVAVKAGYRDLIADFEALLKEEREGERREALREAIALLQGETFKRGDGEVRRLADGNIEYSQS